MNVKPISLLLFTIVFISGCAVAQPNPRVSPFASPPLTIKPGSSLSNSSTVVMVKTTPWTNPQESIVGYKTGDGHYGFRVIALNGDILFEINLPADETPSDITFGGEDSTNNQEIGLISQSRDGEHYHMIVIGVSNGKISRLSEASQETFASHYYPPLLVDLDQDTIPEVVVSIDDPGLPSGFIGNKIYVLSKETYVQSSFLILPPRELQTPTPESK